jgi:hypothetical protein
MGRAVVVVLAIMGVCGAAGGVANVKPRIIERGHAGLPELALPESLKAAMRGYNRNTQLRQWDEYSLDVMEWFDKDHPQAVPWAVWGDFDGNGRTDVALSMRDARACIYKLVAYHQRPGAQWQPYLLSEHRYPDCNGPIEGDINVVLITRGGQSVQYAPPYDPTHPDQEWPRMWLQHDAVTSCGYGKAAVTYYWRDGKYDRIITAD